jgi:hypothetical protein
MKRLLLIACTATVLFGCNDKSGSSTTGTDSTKKTDTKTGDLVYPYKLDKPYQDWQPGDQKHAVTVMTALKAFENNDMATCMKGFGDSVEVFLDGYRNKLSNDSLSKVFAQQRGQYKSLTIKMQDWESVIGKDKDEWVTLWYKESWVDMKGKADSLAIINDAKMVGGKVVILDEKIQHYPAAKK